MPLGAIIGGVGGGVVALLVLGGAVVYAWKAKVKAAAKPPEAEGFDTTTSQHVSSPRIVLASVRGPPPALREGMSQQLPERPAVLRAQVFLCHLCCQGGRQRAASYCHRSPHACVPCAQL